MYLVTRKIYIPPLVTTRPLTRVLYLDDPVSEHVHDLRLAPSRDPPSFGPVQVHVPVQPQAGLVAVYEPQERLEADVSVVLVVAEAERGPMISSDRKSTRLN